MTQWQLKAFKIFTAAGLLIIIIGFVIGIAVANTSSNYLGNNDKATRDAAESGALLDQLVYIQSTARWLEPFIFLGVASMMLGIALEFSTIPQILNQRGKQMSQTLPVIVKGGSQ